MKRFFALALSLCMILALFGCGQQTAETPPAQNDEETPLQVALCLTGPANDGGWCQLAYDGLTAAGEQYGVKFSYTENLQTTDMEAAMTDYAAQGYNLIFGLGFQFGDPALKVAEKYPDVKFVVFEGSVEAENVLSCKISNEQSRYLLGYLAARLSKSGVVGFVAGPAQPSIIKPAEAFKLGARAANPDAKVLISYCESFTDVALAKEAAVAMLDQGADVIGHGANTAGTGAIKACQERGALAMGAAADQNGLAPDTVVCSDMYSFGDVLLYVVGNAVEGKFESGIKSYGFKEGIIQLAPYHDFDSQIPQEVKDEIEDLKQQIIDGSLVVPVIETPTND
ncbi:Purine-binding protein [bioreactor metagenome]|uniref:Purine-binding protein n=1 Tax=bioreactor metagenome TaxID=1076179 RepID=A0A645AHX8_9ZZZZ|nr:BMP family protein [Oscillibacter sp.]